VWWDQQIEAFTCPVREWTPEVEEVEWWFEQTHEIEVLGMGTAVCRCVRLPGPGSVGDQESRLWQALAVLRETTNDVLMERESKTRKPKPTS